MDAKDHTKTNSPGSESHGVHVCNRCGWQYPNPHPSARHRRAHKKICGTIKGCELVHPEKPTEVQGSEDELKTPSPEVVGNGEKKLGGIGAISSRSEQDVFEDAACEFSGSPFSLRSDSFNENEELATMDVEKITENPDEIQQSNSSSTACEMRSSGVSDSFEVSSAEVLENQDPVLSSAEIAASNQQDDETSSAELKSQSVTSETMIGSSQVAQVIGANDSVNDFGLETEDKGNELAYPEGNSRDGLPSELASPMWNDDVIYSEVEGPDEFALENSGTIESTEDESIGSENILVDTSVGKADAAQETASAVSSQRDHGRTTVDKDDNVLFSVPDDIPFVDNAEVSFHGFKGHKELKLNQSANSSLHQTTKVEESETDAANLAESPGIQSGQLSVEKEVPCSDMVVLEDKSKHQCRDDFDSVEEFPVEENVVVVSKFGNPVGNLCEESIASEVLEFIAEKPESTADVNHTSNSICTVDRVGHGNEIIQANDTAEEGKIRTINEGNSIEIEPSSPVPDVLEGDYVSDLQKGSRETCKDTLPRNDSEVCGSNNEKTDFHRVLGGLGVIIQGNQINSNDKTQEHIAEVPVAIESNDHRGFGRLQDLSEAHIRSLAPSLLAATATPSASQAANVIIKSRPTQSGDNASSDKSRNSDSACGVALYSNNRCDSLEAAWRSVSVLSMQSDTPDSINMELKENNMKPSVDAPTRNDDEKPYKFAQPFLDSPTEVDSEIKKPENSSQPSSDAAAAAALSKNQEIMERATSLSAEKQQHVPLKNLLSEARSPRPEAADNNNSSSSPAFPRLSSILGPETSPDSCFPAKGEVSEEWKTPARYPVDVKREERKAKNRPFWVPFVCCSSVN